MGKNIKKTTPKTSNIKKGIDTNNNPKPATEQDIVENKPVFTLLNGDIVRL